MTTRPDAPEMAPQILVDELLGFSPHLLLDDMIDVANTAVGQAVEAMEKQLERWAAAYNTTANTPNSSGKKKEPLTPEEQEQEIEQGMVAFQTLIEFHTDVAFDYLETWSLRNIFTFNAELVPKIVVPHQAGLNLDMRPQEESEILAELEELRVQIDNQRKLKRAAKRAARITSLQASLHERRLARITALRLPNAQTLQALPDALADLRAAAEALPPVSLSREGPTPGKRLWEDGRDGFVRWTAERLVKKIEGEEGLIPGLDADRRDVSRALKAL
ncbi:unnamed protein product [Peniophora sp. CBMAI 1063]|nr:unnamed protein product [Peniophora sp. CBMAI 1063]